MRRKLLAACLLGVLVAGLAISCRAPTQVFVEVSTNVPHHEGIATTFTVGRPGATEAADPTTETRAPFGQDGFVGSLGVVPGDANDDSLSVKIVMGVERDARECVAPEYTGCIVARRTLRYRPNAELRLPIRLDARCLDVPCTEATTCNGAECVPAAVADETCDGPEGCVLAGASDEDASTTVNDAGDIVSTDAALFRDASQPTDGSVAVGLSVDCPGAAEERCFGTFGCCWDPAALTGGCFTSCVSSTKAFMKCDGPEDCIAPPRKCCLTPSNRQARCLSTCGPSAIEVCHSTGECSDGKTCSGLYLGLYRVCQ